MGEKSIRGGDSRQLLITAQRVNLT